VCISCVFMVAAPSQFLLYADSFYGHVGFIDVSSNAASQWELHLIAYSDRPVGVAYDAVTQVYFDIGL
jgi:hypothetical protein